ncbi:MAG: M23 family metallopeptidase [Propionicimonas sp.]
MPLMVSASNATMACMEERVELAYPFRGRWLVQNSPANRVPSHGTRVFATAYAIDFVPVDARGRSAPFTLASLVRPEAADRFPGFGRPILAPASGVVVAVHDGEPDHDAFRGLPSIGYALTQGRRATAGWAGLAGNHVVIELAPGAVVALCHLRRGSISLLRGRRVAAGDPVGQCGNSGNSTEPHLHLQAMDHPDADRASALPFAFAPGLPRNGDVITA